MQCLERIFWISIQLWQNFLFGVGECWATTAHLHWLLAKDWGPFHWRFLPAIQIRCKLRLAVIPLLAIRSQQIFAHATSHDSTAVVPCTKFYSDHCIRIELRVKRNFHRIWIAMEKPLVKRGPGWQLFGNCSEMELSCNYSAITKGLATSWRFVDDWLTTLTHWGRVTHICVCKLTIIGSDNGLSPERRQAVIWTNDGILLIGPLGTNFSEKLLEIKTFSLKKIRLKMSSAKCCSFRLGLNLCLYTWI